MSLPRFIQIHTLHNYPAALLNRDDAGLAKRLPLGDKIRTRISSQCLKRHWRVADDHFALATLGVPMAVRSRAFADKIKERLIQEAHISEAIAEAVVATLKDAFKKDLDKLIKDANKAKAPKKSKTADAEEGTAEEETSAQQKQAILLGVKEYEYLFSVCQKVATSATDTKEAKIALLTTLKDQKDNFNAIASNCGLESSLFGRMVTSDLLASRDAAVYVAHAFTVHEAQVENDYFTVVDDLLRDAGELGSAGIFDTELASGLYYGYVVVDVPQLVANLEGIGIKDCFSAAPSQRELAAQVVHHLLHLIATVSPGAKRGSTAPFEWAKFVLVETGDWQPRSLAGAYQNALPLNTSNIRLAAAQRLADEAARLDAAYGAPLQRRYLALDNVSVPNAERLPLAALAQWVQQRIVQGAAADSTGG